MHKTGFYILILAVALLLLAGVFGPMFFTEATVENKEVRIERGMGALEIAELLETSGIIKQQAPFLLYVVLTGNRNRLQAGEYSFDGNYAPYEVADLLSEGFSLSREKTVTIPEGYTIKDIEAALEESGVEKVGDIESETPATWGDFFSFVASIPSGSTLEGFLFPDTYRFEKEATNDVVVRKMLANFEVKTRELRAEADGAKADFYEVVILASILEKEVPPEDMKRASGVLSKRLEAGMPLQSDATLVYGLGRPIVRRDIDTFNSPYNTYKFKGLPPSPISNPGLAAIEAALKPEDNDFWYYLTRPDTGETIFSRTFQFLNLW